MAPAPEPIEGSERNGFHWGNKKPTYSHYNPIYCITGRETSCSFSVFFQKSWMKKMLTVGQVHEEMRGFANFVGRAVSMSSPKYQNMRRLFAGSNQEPHKKNTNRDPIHIRSSPTYGSFIPNNHSCTNHCHCWAREKGHMKPWDHAFLRTVQANSPWNLPPGPLPRLRKKTSFHGLCLRMPL